MFDLFVYLPVLCESPELFSGQLFKFYLPQLILRIEMTGKPLAHWVVTTSQVARYAGFSIITGDNLLEAISIT